MKQQKHSPKVQQIMQQEPAFIVRWGNLLLILLIILGGVIYLLIS